MTQAVIIGLAILASGCARLEVGVDVMNPVYAKQAARDAELKIEAQQLADGGHQRADIFVARAFEAYTAFRTQCLEEAEADARKSAEAESNAKTKAGLITYADGAKQDLADPALIAAIDKAQRDMRDILYAQDIAVGKLVRSAGGTIYDGNLISAELQTALAKRSEVFQEQKRLIFEWIEEQSLRCQNSVSANVADSEALLARVNIKKDTATGKVESSANRSIIGGGRLLNELTEAYFITNADKQYWANKYNRAVGEGFGGSTSIAVKMNDTADFSIKGFVFDGRSTAEMIRKVSVQAVSLLAASQGAPVGLLKPQGAGSGAAGSSSLGVPDPSKLVADTQSTILAANVEDSAFRAMLFRLSDTVLANWDELVKGTDSAEKRAKDTFDAYKDVWKRPAK